MFQLLVFRDCRRVAEVAGRDVGEAEGRAAGRSCPGCRTSTGVMSAKKSTGDHCQPARTSLTRFDENVTAMRDRPGRPERRLRAEQREARERRIGAVQRVRALLKPCQ